MQPLSFASIERPALPRRMNPCSKKRFIRVDIADPGNAFLIEQKSFDWRRSIPGEFVEAIGGECVVERFGPDAALFCRPFRICEPQDPAKLTLVRIGQSPTVAKPNTQVLEPNQIVGRTQQQKLPRHHQVNEQSVSVFECEPEMLASPVDPLKCFTGNELGERPRIDLPHDAWKGAKFYRFYGGADDAVEHRTADSFDFRELRHVRSINAGGLSVSP